MNPLLMTSTTDVLAFYAIKNVEGRSFVIQHPYAGVDGVLFEIFPNCVKPCKILGFAPRNSIERTISPQEAKKIIVDDD